MIGFRTGMMSTVHAGLVVGAMCAFATAAQAQSSCKWYGATALKQQKQNEKLGCGFTGSAWHSNLSAHMSWCQSQPPDVWKAAARERDKMLAKCARR